MIVFLITVGILILGIWLFLRLNPAFGGKPSPEQLRRYARSPHWNGQKFVYPEPTRSFQLSPGNIMSLLRDYLRGNDRIRPSRPLPVVKLEPSVWTKPNGDNIIWLGHSALLLHIGGKRLLLDPMLGPSPTPVPPFGGKRYAPELPFNVDELPQVDAILFSHDHYDHLDYGTIVRLKDKTKRFIVPLGVSCHLERWGVNPERISEHDWWDELEWEGLKLVCTPARHFSGRGRGKRDRSLWCSWVINSAEQRIFFSGDSGYGPHFGQIGKKYGPFDLALIECGQYDVRWIDVHMLPEQTVQACLEVRGKRLLPIHWGAFTLALHDWDDPIRRVAAQAEMREMPLATPKIGEILPLKAGVAAEFTAVKSPTQEILSVAAKSDAWWN